MNKTNYLELLYTILCDAEGVEFNPEITDAINNLQTVIEKTPTINDPELLDRICDKDIRPLYLDNL